MQSIIQQNIDIDTLSDEDLQSLLDACAMESAVRKQKKLCDDKQIYCDLYDDAWLKLKFRFYEDNAFESQYMLVHIGRVLNIYSTSANNNTVTVDATYIEQYHIDVLDEDDVDLRHVKACKDPLSVNNITFETDDVIEFVKSDQVEKIVENVIDLLK